MILSGSLDASSVRGFLYVARLVYFRVMISTLQSPAGSSVFMICKRSTEYILLILGGSSWQRVSISITREGVSEFQELRVDVKSEVT